MHTLTPSLVHEVLKRFFPIQNDNCECAYEEELRELNDFGISTEGQLVGLLQKRAEEVMEIDRSPMSDVEIRASFEFDDEGERAVKRRLHAGFWFSFPALLRIALELEFKKAYEEYANKRDGVA